MKAGRLPALRASEMTSSLKVLRQPDRLAQHPMARSPRILARADDRVERILPQSRRGTHSTPNHARRPVQCPGPSIKCQESCMRLAVCSICPLAPGICRQSILASPPLAVERLIARRDSGMLQQSHQMAQRSKSGIVMETTMHSSPT